jgi:uncharacterized protein (DUF305 family)
MRALFAIAFLFVLSLPLSAAPQTVPSPRPAATATPNPTATVLPKLNGQAFDIAFMKAEIPIHEEAVEIAMAATLNADHVELLRWNQRLIDRKNEQVRRMLVWLQEEKASPGRRNVGVATDPVKKMRALKGASLEKVYIPLMAAHLEQSLALARLAAMKATRPELRELAQRLVSTEAREVSMLRDWMKQRYGT